MPHLFLIGCQLLNAKIAATPSADHKIRSWCCCFDCHFIVEQVDKLFFGLEAQMNWSGRAASTWNHFQNLSDIQTQWMSMIWKVVMTSYLFNCPTASKSVWDLKISIRFQSLIGRKCSSLQVCNIIVAYAGMPHSLLIDSFVTRIITSDGVHS